MDNFQGECKRIYISHEGRKPKRKECGARVPLWYKVQFCHSCLLELIAK
jgi:hypothetical protein